MTRIVVAVVVVVGRARRTAYNAWRVVDDTVAVEHLWNVVSNGGKVVACSHVVSVVAVGVVVHVGEVLHLMIGIKRVGIVVHCHDLAAFLVVVHHEHGAVVAELLSVHLVAVVVVIRRYYILIEHVGVV